MKKLIGIILLVTGIVLLLVNYNVIQTESNFRLIWPIILILITLDNIIQMRRIRFFNVILLGVGSYFVLRALDISLNTYVSENVLYASVLIIIGLYFLLFRRSIFKDKFHFSSSHSSKNGTEYNAVMSGIDEKVIDDHFETCQVSVVMGSAELDMSEVKLATNKASLELNSIMGGIEITLPKGCRLIVSGTPIMGGFENNYISDPSSEKVVMITYTCVMGGIEVR
ncbi:MAG: DUF5668 domain-containing protein [Erysipelotrichaceae bacterium]